MTHGGKDGFSRASSANPTHGSAIHALSVGERRAVRSTDVPIAPVEAASAAMTPDTIVWDYKWTERYEKGDAIAHPRFGRGFIESVTTDDMEVLFREGRKRMAMNRPEAGQ